jgi:hypothetical protein
MRSTPTPCSTLNNPIEQLPSTTQEEIARLRVRNGELMAADEDASQMDRRYRDLEASQHKLLNRLEEQSRELAESSEEVLLVKTTLNIEADALRVENERLFSQCEQLLRQNHVLLKTVGEVELANTLGSGAIPGSESEQAHAQTVKQYENKLRRTNAALEVQEKRNGELSAAAADAQRLRDQLREKNIIIKQMKANQKEIINMHKDHTATEDADTGKDGGAGDDLYA